MVQQFAEFHTHAIQTFLKNMLLYSLIAHVLLTGPFVCDISSIYFLIIYPYPVSRVSILVSFLYIYIWLLPLLALLVM